LSPPCWLWLNIVVSARTFSVSRVSSMRPSQVTVSLARSRGIPPRLSGMPSPRATASTRVTESWATPELASTSGVAPSSVAASFATRE